MIKQQMEKTIQSNPPIPVSRPVTWEIKPHGRKKVDMITGGKAAYAKYCEQQKQKVSYKQYRQIIWAINRCYIDYMLNTGHKVIFPYGIGKMCVNRFKRIRKIYTSKDGTETFYSCPVNWGESKKQGRIVYFLNENSDGYTYHWKWFRFESRMENPQIWKLVMTINAKKTLSHYVSNSNNILMFSETGTKKSNLKAFEEQQRLEREENEQRRAVSENV